MLAPQGGYKPARQLQPTLIMAMIRAMADAAAVACNNRTCPIAAVHAAQLRGWLLGSFAAGQTARHSAWHPAAVAAHCPWRATRRWPDRSADQQTAATWPTDSAMLPVLFQAASWASPPPKSLAQLRKQAPKTATGSTPRRACRQACDKHTTNHSQSPCSSIGSPQRQHANTRDKRRSRDLRELGGRGRGNCGEERLCCTAKGQKSFPATLPTASQVQGKIRSTKSGYWQKRSHLRPASAAAPAQLLQSHPDCPD